VYGLILALLLAPVVRWIVVRRRQAREPA
jgi:hypothetical protein